MKIYAREIIHYPYRNWIEYFTDEETANKAYEVTDASKDIYVRDAGIRETEDIELFFYGRIANKNDYNNTPEEIRKKLI